MSVLEATGKVEYVSISATASVVAKAATAGYKVRVLGGVLVAGASGASIQLRAGGTNEIQRVTITGSPTGGTFTLTYSGQTTAGIAFDATAATVDAALEALSNIGAGDVTCTGGPLPGTAVDVEFTNQLGLTDVAAMTASGAGLTGGASPAVAITTPTPGVAATALTGIMVLAAGGSPEMTPNGIGYGDTAVAEALNLNVSAGAVQGSLVVQLIK